MARDLADIRLSRIPISRLAAARGITNPSMFARLFRLREGCTPSEFRMRNARADAMAPPQVWRQDVAAPVLAG